MMVKEENRFLPHDPAAGDIETQVRRVLYLLGANPQFRWAVEELMNNRGYGDITVKFAKGFRLHRVRVEKERDSSCP